MNSSLETQLGDELRELASHQPFMPDVDAIGQRARQRHRRGRALRGATAAGAGAGAVAAAVALVLAASPAPRPATAPGSAAGPATVHARLTALAADIQTRSGSQQPGSAWLIIRTQAIGSRPPYVTYNLYTAGGAIYVTDTRSQLRRAIAHHENLADGTQARQVAAARYAATGELTAARLRMINVTRNYLGLGLSPAAQRKVWAKGMAAARKVYKEKGIKRQPKWPTRKSIREQADNIVWINSVDALSESGGSPQVRAGVLRLISTITGVTVANSMTGGQHSLTITAGPEVFGGQGKQVLKINARTGMPISSWVGDLGPTTPSSLATYKVSSVTLAGIGAGRF
jgi:hypothetical protein